MRSIFWLLLVTAIVYGFGLGDAGLWDIDEAIYADISRNMANTGDWTFPVFNGEPRFDKPPLLFWISAAAISVSGPGELSVRIGTYMFALAGIMLVYMFGARLYSPRAGLLAALALASTLGWFIAGRIGLLDTGLSFFVGLAVYQLLRIPGSNLLPSGEGESGTYEPRELPGRGPLPGGPAPYPPYIWMGVALALGVLTKGPVALVLFGGTALAYFGPKQFAQAFLGRRNLVSSLAGAAVFASIALPWHVAIYARAGRAWLDSYFGYHMFSRFTQSLEDHGFGWYFYLVVLVVGILPWTGHAVAGGWDFITRLRTRTASESRASMWLPTAWFLVVLVFFSISRTKLPGYILPAFLPVAVLTGAWLDRRLKQAGADLALTKGLWASVGAGLLAIVGLVALRSAVPEGYEAAYRLLFLFPASLVAGLLITKALHANLRDPQTLVYGFAGTALIGMLLFTPLLAPLLEEHKPIRTLVAAASNYVPADAQLVSAFGDASTNYYWGRPVTYVDTAQEVQQLLARDYRALAIVPLTMLPELPGVTAIESYGPAALVRQPTAP